MAYSITYQRFVGAKNKPFLIEAVLDSAEDLAALGTGYAPGSTAVVADSTAKVFMLNASGEWRELA